MEENSVLITAQFIDAGSKMKNEKRIPKHYDIELIVQKDIKCDQLLAAIRSGLTKKLRGSKKDEPDKEVVVLRTDTRHPELEQGEEQPTTEAENLVDEVESPAGNAEKKVLTDHDIYSICIDVFEECMGFYDGSSADDPSSVSCIGRGSINFRILSEGEKHSVAHEDQVWLLKNDHGEKTLAELGFITSTRIVFDKTGWHSSAALFQEDEVCEAFSDDVPLYNISDSPIFSLDNEPVRIIPPTDPPKKNKQNLLISLLSPLLMMGAMVVARLFSGTALGGGGMIFMTVSMSAVTLFIAVLNMINQRKEHEGAIKEWKEHYEQYIQRLLTEIKNKQDWDTQQLIRIYPDKIGSKNHPGLVNMAVQVHSDIFSRSQNHPNFLNVRLGLSAQGSHLVSSAFQIVGEKKDAVFTSARYKNLENKDRYPFRILLKDKKNDSDGYLTELPLAISEKYAHLENAPVLLKLKDCGALGVVIKEAKQSFQPLLDNLLLDLCFYHSPDDLQCILFCERFQENKDGKSEKISEWQYRENVLEKYKHLPHFKELLIPERQEGDVLSAFAFDEDDTNLILNRLLEKIAERKEAEEGTKFPHIVLFFLDEYGFKRHPVSQYLPDILDEANLKKLGLTFVFFKRHAEKLPKYCGQIIEVVDNKLWRLLPHERSIKQDIGEQLYDLKPDAPPPESNDLDMRETFHQYHRTFKILSALYYYRIAQGAGVPSRVELLQLYGDDIQKATKEELATTVNRYIGTEWDKNSWLVTPADAEENDTPPKYNVTKSLSVPIGLKSDKETIDEKDIINLDLHEKADGPHMLVAGTTGSGKSETILTYLIGLCVRYTPEQVNLLLVDMKGGGFIKRIGKLPHVVGTVTDVDGDENGSGAAYMLKRFLRSMSAEIKRRKILFNQLEVDSIDGYITARATVKNLENHIKNLKLDEKDSEHKLRIDRMRKLLKPQYALAHLFMVVDEFTELMRFSAENGDIDFKVEITTLARVGRSLGFHIILVSQNIEGAITDDIRVNSRARLCLKVATREASKEMIGTDLAASPLMPGNGRAYLLVGTGSRFEYFQSAFSGASIIRNTESQIIVTHAAKNGRYTTFYDSYQDDDDAKKQDQEAKRAGTQLQLIVDQVSVYADSKKKTAPQKVFQPPLPARCYYEFERKKIIHLKKTEEAFEGRES